MSSANSRNIFSDFDGLFFRSGKHLSSLLLQFLGRQLLGGHDRKHCGGKALVNKANSQFDIGLEIMNQCPNLTGILGGIRM